MKNIDYGTLDCGDTLVTLTQEAYISDCGNHYFAHGEYTEDGIKYLCKVRWDVTGDDTEDESDMCDWNDFYVEELGAA